MEQQRPLTRREQRFFKPKRPSRVTIPACAHPLVKVVFAEMLRQQITYDAVDELSGVLRTTVKAWRHKNKPGLDSIEAVLGALGLDLVPIPRTRVLPPELVAALTPIAEQFGMTMPATTEALVAIVSGIHDKFPLPDAAPATAPAIEDLASL